MKDIDIMARFYEQVKFLNENIVTQNQILNMSLFLQLHNNAFANLDSKGIKEKCSKLNEKLTIMFDQLK